MLELVFMALPLRVIALVYRSCSTQSTAIARGSIPVMNGDPLTGVKAPLAESTAYTLTLFVASLATKAKLPVGSSTMPTDVRPLDAEVPDSVKAPELALMAYAATASALLTPDA
jgi:hypothetical protein